jgi:hypothetical protein
VNCCWNKRCLGAARKHAHVAPIVRIKMSININRNSIMNKNLHLLLHLLLLRFLVSDTFSTVAAAVVAPTSVQSVLVAMQNVVVVEEHEVEARRCEVAGRAQSPSRAHAQKRPHRTHRRRRRRRKLKHFKVLDIDCLMANQCECQTSSTSSVSSSISRSACCIEAISTRHMLSFSASVRWRSVRFTSSGEMLLGTCTTLTGRAGVAAAHVDFAESSSSKRDGIV